VTDQITLKRYTNLPRFGLKAGQPNPISERGPIPHSIPERLRGMQGTNRPADF